MEKVLTLRQAKQIDLFINKKIGLPTLVMMENAGIRVAEFVKKILKNNKEKKIVIFCGKGNNAGDGLVCARQLISEEFKVDIFLLSLPGELSQQAKINYNILKKLNIKIKIITSGSYLDSIDLSSYTVIVDAIFGIGLKRKIEGVYREVIEKINSSSATVVSIDIPSGLDGNRGLPLDVAIKADYTLTFIAMKKGLLINQGPKFSGKILVEHIGVRI
ncbi:MAG: NAD(P)H-hydrate epimerase [Candidatus Omnitrophica bacterium]|nr:NAD(P)H-hydrate epimerase [Candidatus Omnitrophota bacterium]